ncbi:MAG: PAS domain-containing sensor histidine kinase [Methanoregula sp.]
MFRNTHPQKHLAWNGTDIVRACVITSLIVSCTLILVLAFSRTFGVIATQLFYIPLLYAVYYYPKRGILIAGVCGIIYEIVGYFFYYPNPDALIATVGQAILYIVVAAIIAQLIEQVRTGTSKSGNAFDTSRIGTICFRRRDLSICQCNSTCATLLRYIPEELTTMTIKDILPDAHEKERFSGLVKTGSSFDNFPARVVTKDGENRQVIISGNPVSEEIVCCTVISRDDGDLPDPAVWEAVVKYRQLTDHSPTGILIVGQGIIRYANPAFFEFSGYLPSEITGKELALLIDTDDPAAYTAFAKRWEDPDAQPDRLVCRFRTRHGETRMIALYTAPIVHSGNPATLITIVDLSEKEQLEERIRRENERRRGVLMTVAHELRTPLQPIMGYLDLLMEDPKAFGLTEDTKKIIARCMTSVERERQIINQMLDLSVLETGKLRLSYTIFALAPLVRNVLEVRNTAKDEIVVDIPETLTITADRDRLFTVLDALISNAIKYSTSPRKIRISYYSGNEDPCHYLSVQDNGVGIPHHAINSIFEPFQLADAAKLSRKYDRMGLSLSITKKIIELHGGDIKVQSRELEGSTFTIHIPKTKPHDR